MIEKIKEFGLAAKNAILFIVTPLLLLVFVVVHYILERKYYKDQISKDKLDANLEGDKIRQENIDAEGKSSQSDYERIRDAYRNKPGNGGQS